MKLLNLNIGIKIDNTLGVIDLISKDSYDIVALQEAMRGLDNGVLEKYNSSNIIRQKTNYEYSFFGPLWVAVRHIKNGVVTKDFGGLAEQGNEILSKYPIVDARNAFYYKDYAIHSDTTNFRREDHPRAIIEAIINTHGKMLQIINVHGIWNENKTGDERTMAEAQFIASKIRTDIPSIVVGDFNLLPDTESIKILNEKLINLGEKYNIKTTRPTFDDGLDKGNLICDYIFVNDKVKVNDFKVINAKVSDHFPLMLDFDI